MKLFNSIRIAKSPQLLKSLLLSSAVATGTFAVLPINSVLAAPITYGSIYGSYSNGTNFNSLRTYVPSTASLSDEICDRINPNQTYQPKFYGGTDLGMTLQIGATTNPVTPLTSTNDPTIDRGQYIPALGTVPSDCNLPGTNTNGTTVLDLTGPTGSPTLTTLPYNSYGVWRFTTKVN
jgi:hypothetical protein